MDSSEYSPLTYSDNLIVSEGRESLELSVNLDSIDIITFPCIGNLIRNFRIKLLQTFNPTYIESPKYMSNRSNFTYFRDLDPKQYPGNIFHTRNVSGRGSDTFTVLDGHPIAVTVFHLFTSLYSTYIRVRAIVPSACVASIQSGEPSLNTLFCAYMENSISTTNNTCI